LDLVYLNALKNLKSRSSIFSLVGNPVRNSNQYGSLAQMMRVYVGVTTRSTDIDANHTYRVAKVLSVCILIY
jgi:hypothetical protein